MAMSLTENDYMYGKLTNLHRDDQFNDTYVKILNYDPVTKRCKIQMQNPNGSCKIYRVKRTNIIIVKPPNPPETLSQVNDNNNAPDVPEMCPLCSSLISSSNFLEHIEECVDDHDI
eukprot:254733_1